MDPFCPLPMAISASSGIRCRNLVVYGRLIPKLQFEWSRLSLTHSDTDALGDLSHTQASHRYKIQLEGLEDQLLERLADAPADILADVDLIEVTAHSLLCLPRSFPTRSTTSRYSRMKMLTFVPPNRR